MLLWTYEETARQLGGVSPRTVRRMVESGKISRVRVRGLVRILADSVLAYVACNTSQVHNIPRVGSLAWKGDDPCYTNQTRRLTILVGKIHRRNRQKS